jgi:starvation-inducible DNA-binding protein
MSTTLERPLPADVLQAELRDLLCLAVLGDHIRWVLTGDDAAELRDWLADAVPQWRRAADRVAKHLVTLGVAPDGRLRSLAKDMTLNWVPDGWLSSEEARRLVDHRVRNAAGRARYRRSRALVPDTVQLLEAVSTGLETQARSRDDIALDDSARERLNKNAAVRAENLRRRARQP